MLALPEELNINGVRYCKQVDGDGDGAGPEAPPPPAQPDTQAQRSSGFAWSARSLKRLSGVHPQLRRVMDHALTLVPLDITVLEGVRSKARQQQLVASKASRTMNSRHLTGHALDIAPLDADGHVSFDWPLYHRIAPAIKQAARELGVPIEWGGDWSSFPDGPHWQLPWDEYPA